MSVPHRDANDHAWRKRARAHERRRQQIEHIASILQAQSEALKIANVNDAFYLESIARNLANELNMLYPLITAAKVDADRQLASKSQRSGRVARASKTHKRP